MKKSECPSSDDRHSIPKSTVVEIVNRYYGHARGENRCDIPERMDQIYALLLEQSWQTRLFKEVASHTASTPDRTDNTGEVGHTWQVPGGRFPVDENNIFVFGINLCKSRKQTGRIRPRFRLLCLGVDKAD